MTKDETTILTMAVRDIVRVLTAGYTDEEKGTLDIYRTPERVAKMLLQETRRPAHGPPDIHLTEITPDERTMVCVGPITFSSTCAHHMLPFSGVGWFVYLPDGVIGGLSKFARLLRHFSAGLTLQERITSAWSKHLCEVLSPLSSLAVLRATHGCVTCRGVRDVGQQTVTSAYTVRPDATLLVSDPLNEMYRMVSMTPHTK